MADNFSIEATRIDGVLVLAVYGDLDPLTAPQLGQAIAGGLTNETCADWQKNPAATPTSC